MRSVTHFVITTLMFESVLRPFCFMNTLLLLESVVVDVSGVMYHSLIPGVTCRLCHGWGCRSNDSNSECSRDSNSDCSQDSGQQVVGTCNWVPGVAVGLAFGV